MSDASPTVFNGRYVLQRPLARGGMADVFLAYDELLDRPIAVKVLFPEFASDPAFVERFRREAQAAANLNHPNIVGIYDWGQENGTYFIVMEYIEGRSLAEIIRSDGALDPERAVEITADVAAALAFAHRSGLVHRDIKPGNVLVTPAGQVKVADFGIATAANAGDPNLTKTGLVMGTATYFSPEQAQGKGVDPRSDLYSLGVVLYEMLAGEPPFKGENPVAIAYQHVQEPPPGLRARGVPINAPLEAITFKLLAKNPAHRYPTAEDLRADLRRWREGMHRLAQPGVAAGAAAAAAAAGVPVDATRSMPATGAVPPQSLPPLAPATAAPPPGRSNAARTGTFAVLIVLVLIVLAAIFLLLFTGDSGDGGPSNGGRVDVVSYIDKPAAEAQAALKALGLVPVVIEEENVDKQPGIVFRQDPVGQKVEVGSKVTLTVSKGKTSVAIPSVIGSPIDEAEARLVNEFKLVVTKVPDPKSTRPEGEVTKQDPAPGTKLAPGQGITLTFSQPDNVPVVDVTGQSAAVATANLTAKGFEVAAIEEASDTVEAGKVIRTDPVANTPVKPRSKVTIVVSSGVPKVAVPDVVGLLTDAARQTIEREGLKIDVRFTTVPAGSPNVGRVMSQNPLGNVQVGKGTTVVVSVGVAGTSPTTAPPTTAPPTTAAPTTTR
jgi:beta-lactam-binding protein with PASTA domain